MRNDFILPDTTDELAASPGSGAPLVIQEAFSPLLARIEQEQPALLPALLKLKELVGEENFARHINNLQNIRRNDTTVMLITDSALTKTYIEGNFLKQIEEAFGVQLVRIVCLG